MALTKTVDGKALPKEQFAYVGDPSNIATWHLPIDDSHIDSALKMFGHETHVPSDQKTAVARKIAATAKAKGFDTKDFEANYCRANAEHAETPSLGHGWIEIFRAGDYTAQGKVKVTPEQLQGIVDRYDPGFHEAPVVVGHPQADAPAYGWIEAIALRGDTLLAKEKQVDASFDELRTAGRFKKRSAAFYQDGDGAPIYLRHVAWLGAQPPAVKGLKDAAFSEHGKGFVEFEEDVMAGETEKSVKEQIKAFFVEMFGNKPGDGGSATFSEADVKRIAAEAVTAATAPLQAKIATLEGDLKNHGAKFSERETAMAAAELKQRASGAVAQLKAAGRWVPAFERMGLEAIFSELAKSTVKLEFGEGDAKKQVSPLDLMVTFLEGLPKIVPSGTVFQGRAGADAKRSDDPLTAATRELMKKDSKLTFTEAMIKAADEHPELTVAGQGSAGSV
jgi:hypothetical protein